MNPELVNQIIKAYQEAVKKHPYFCEGNFHKAISLATEELGETAQALNDGRILKVREEALDTIAVLVRLIQLIDDLEGVIA